MLFIKPEGLKIMQSVMGHLPHWNINSTQQLIEYRNTYVEKCLALCTQQMMHIMRHCLNTNEPCSNKCIHSTVLNCKTIEFTVNEVSA